MKRALQSRFALSCLLLASTFSFAAARDSVLTDIPRDVFGFYLIHDLTDVSRTIGELAKIVNAPAPDLLMMLKGMSGLQKGVDENGDVAVVVTSFEPTKTVVLVPVANFTDLFASLKITDPAPGLADVQLLGQAIVVGRKGNFAVFAHQSDREDLEKFLASTDAFTTDETLSTWLDSNKASAVVTTLGIKKLADKLGESIHAAEELQRQHPDDTSKAKLDAMKLYASLLDAAEPEVDQFALGLHVDALHNIDLVSRSHFKPDGSWAHWAATLTPSNEDLLAGLPADPFFMAFGGAVPPGSRAKLHEAYSHMMQNSPQLNLSPDDAKTYADLAAAASRDVRSIRMVVGATEPGASLFSNAVYIFTLDDTAGYLDRYEKSLAALHEFTAKLNNPKLPSSTCQRISVDGVEALEVSTVMPASQIPQRPNAPDPKKLQQLFFGEDNTLKLYMAPADEHTVVLAYTSPESLKTAIDFYKSQQPGLSSDPRVAAVSVMLPLDAQAVGYFDLSSAFAIGKQMMPVLPGARMPTLPDLDRSPPIGIAARVAPEGLETHLVLSAETLQSIGAAITEARAPH